MDVYATFGADGSAVEVPTAGGFQTHFVKVMDQAEAEHRQAEIGELVPQLAQHNSEALANYSAEDLERYAIRKLAIDPPPSKVVDAYSLSLDANGAITFHATFKDPPSRGLPHEIPMYKVRNKLIDLELDDDVEALLAAMPGKAGKRARNLWASAPMFLPEGDLGQTFKAALGLTNSQFETWCWEAFDSEG